MISICTPVIDHPAFIEAYAQATAGAEVVIVDTGSTPENRKRWMSVGRLVDYPTKGHNYGHWCNAGFAHATGDIVIFLNNDVCATGDWLAEAARDVQPGAIYGPELQAQTVAGVTVPFLSGWCIAATREMWDQLVNLIVNIAPPMELLGHIPVFKAGDETGPWNTRDYPAAGYWEDNDLSFRAVMAGIELVQTKWPITHLDGGNGTSKHTPAYYADVERNKRTFERMVRAAMYAANPLWGMEASHA